MAFKLRKYVYYGIVFVLMSMGSFWGVQHFFKLDIEFSELTPSLLVFLGAMIVVYVLLDALRFYWILKIMKTSASYITCVQLVLIGASVSTITPFLAGGSLAQIYLLSRDGASVGRVTAATSVRAVLASTFFFAIVPLVFYFNGEILGSFFDEIRVILPIMSIGYLFWLSLIIVVSFHHQKLLHFLNRKTEGRKHEARYVKMISEFDVFLNGMRMFLSSGARPIVIAFAVTIAHFMFVFLFAVAILYGLGYWEIPFYKISAYQMMAHFVMYFGFTPGASGFAEGSFAYIFSKIVREQDLALIVFLWRLCTVYLTTVIGFILLLKTFYQHRMRSHI